MAGPHICVFIMQTLKIFIYVLLLLCVFLLQCDISRIIPMCLYLILPVEIVNKLCSILFYAHSNWDSSKIVWAVGGAGDTDRQKVIWSEYSL